MPAIPEIEDQKINNSPKVVSLEAAQVLADQAASKAISLYKNNLPSNAGDDDVNLDREIKIAFKKKMTTPSLGERLGEAIDMQLSEQVVQRLIPNLFGSDGLGVGGGGTKREGAAGFILDILNTQFAYGAGQTLGSSASEVIKALGQERVGKLIDTYNQKMNPDGNSNPSGQEQTLTPEQQQKQAESTIMSLDSTNQEHVLNFMQAVGIKDFGEAQKSLLLEQDRILKSRGLVKEEVNIGKLESDSKQDKSKYDNSKQDKSKQDLNRQLIDQYDRGDNQGANQDIDQGNQFSPGFFDDRNPHATDPFINERIPTGLKEDEFILSLNPDDPISQQEYMSFRHISGVPLDMIKKMLIKEQNKFRSGVSESNITFKEQPVLDQSSDVNSIPPLNTPTDSIQDSNNLSEEFKPIKKEDFYKEIGLGKSIDEINKEKELLNNGQVVELEESNPMSSLNTIMRVLTKLDTKIDYLETELVKLKSEKRQEVEEIKNEQPIVEEIKEKIKEEVTEEKKDEITGEIKDEGMEGKTEEVKEEKKEEKEEFKDEVKDEVIEKISEEIKIDKQKDDEVNESEEEVEKMKTQNIRGIMRKKFVIKRKEE